ncbi:hypothetical protein EJ593_01930, partial [Pseudomonas aeruginosa]
MSTTTRSASAPPTSTPCSADPGRAPPRRPRASPPAGPPGLETDMAHNNNSASYEKRRGWGRLQTL